MRPRVSVPPALAATQRRILALNDPAVNKSRLWRRWRDEGADPFLVRTIRYGFRPHMRSAPAPSRGRARWLPPRDNEEQQGRQGLLAKLLAKKFAAPSDDDRFCSPWWAEPKKEDDGTLSTTRFRFLHNLKAINRHLTHPKVRYEGLTKVPSLALPGDQCTVSDLVDFFYSTELHPSFRKYCTFLHKDNAGVTTAYAMCVLPMGLSASPWITAKLTRFVIGILRGLGLRPLLYVDDLLLLAPPSDIDHHHLVCRKAFEYFGWIWSTTKGTVDGPAFASRFLGLDLNFAKRFFEVPQHKTQQVLDRCRRTLQHACSHRRFVPRRALAGLVGLVESLHLATPTTRVWLRELSTLSVTGLAWDRRRWGGSVKLSHQGHRDIAALQAHFAVTRRSPFDRLPPDYKCYTDASVHSWGGVLGGKPSTATRGHWGQRHPSGDITLLELRGFRLFVEATTSLRACVLLPYIDNRSVVSALRRWSSPTPRVMDELRLTRQLLDARGISVPWCEWIPTAENVAADDLSRAADPAEYRWSPRLALAAAARWPQLGPTQNWVDAFASASAHQPGFAEYHARYPDPQAGRADTLQAAWAPDSGPVFLTPPLAILGQALEKFEREGHWGVLIHPVWHAQPWWPRYHRLVWDSFEIPHLDTAVIRVPANPALPEPLRNRGWSWRVSLLRSSGR